jgi:hypothetical protein
VDVEQFTVEVRDANLVRVGQFTAKDLTDFLVVPRANQVGSWSIKLPANVISDAGVESPHVLCSELRVPGAGIIVTGPGGVILSGPMVSPTYDASTSDPGGTWTIEGVSDLILLADALAWGDPSTYSLTNQNTSNDVQTDVAETLIHSYVSRNIGSDAVTERANARLVSATDQGRGPLLQKSPRFQNLLELVQEIVTGTDLLVDVVQVDSQLELRVTESADLSLAVRMDIENDQLSSSQYHYTAPGVTDVLVAGMGDGVARTIINRSNATAQAASAAWGRRIERFVDQRQTDVLAELEQAGDELLATEGDTVKAFQVVPNSNLGLVYGINWSVGAKVTIVIQGVESVAVTSEAPISITKEGVFVGATIGNSVSAFDWESIIETKQSTLDARVSSLETAGSGSSGGAFGNLDNGFPNSTFGGVTAIDCGGI